ncbi:MAG: hypothetical protein U5L04_02380 [Trueperaceae bacterium]|nr:hypothetical protein [Trueperaceae bacterium]
MSTTGITNFDGGVSHAYELIDLLEKLQQHIETSTHKNELHGMIERRRTFWQYDGQGFPTQYVGRTIEVGGCVVAVHWSSRTNVQSHFALRRAKLNSE